MDSVVAGDGWSCWWSRWGRRSKGGSRWRRRKRKRWLLLQPPPQPAPASLWEGQELKKVLRTKHVGMELKPKCQDKSHLSILVNGYGWFFHWI